MKRLSMIMMCLFAMIAISLSNRAQEVMISLTSGWNQSSNPDTVTIIHREALSGFVPMGDNVNRSQFCFIADGNWNDGSKWNTSEVPAIGSDVVIMANAVIPAGYIAVANEVSIQGGSITVADGGQLRHNTDGLMVTMKKNIEPYSEINGIGNYYLLGFPFSENVNVPTSMTATPGNDFYWFDSNSPGAEWRNNKQEAIATVGGTTGYLYANPEALEISLAGHTYSSYNDETKTVTIPYTENSTNLSNGWALLGNPFICDAYIYYYDSDNVLVPMDYMVYNTEGELDTLSNGPIAPMQGFFVKVTETTTVCIKNYAVHDYVDLGLPSGTLWATCNIGATTSEEYGDYFAWGETQPKDTYNWSTYQYCNGSSNTLTKYCNNSNYGYNGFTDNLTTLLPEDDIATANWGSEWRMPTEEEWQELCDNTTVTETTQNGVNGRLYTASNGNTLFLPATGYMEGGNLIDADSNGNYWSCSLFTSSPSWARTFYFWAGQFLDYHLRCKGLSVRAVRSSVQITSFIIEATANPTEGGLVIGSGTYEEGTESTLTATANEGYTFTNWTEDGEEVSAEATYSFTVTGNRNLVANFSVSSGDHDYVDLGLPSGLLWATCNIGASSPEEYGDYFAWGETQSKDTYSWSTYQYCNGNYNTLTKYCNNSSYGYNGFTDNLTTLQSEDDAATANWGSGWRMPTKEDWHELYNNTTCTWTTQNGVSGRLFTATNGNSLFLPASGFRGGSSLNNVGSYGNYWSSSLYTDYPSDVWGLYFESDFCYVNCGIGYTRLYGQSVRAVRSAQPTPANYTITVISSPTEGGTVTGGGTYQQGQTCTVTATANTGYTFVNWTENGIVVSNDTSYSFIVSENRTLVANFTYSGGSNHEYVDLGLPSGLLWATCNVGAEVPEDYGDYFAWGETQPKDIYNSSTYQHCNGSSTTLTKYCSNSSYGYNGFIDNLTTLLPDDDAALVNWGNEWRMPTQEEWQELIDNTTSAWTMNNGVNGRVFTASNGNSIFFPAAGCRGNSNLFNAGFNGNYWSSSLGSSYDPGLACDLLFSSDDCGMSMGYRDYGFPVRPVRSTQPISVDYTITVTPSPTDGGTVMGGGIYQQGQSCTVTATANTGYTFDNWTENGIVVSNDVNYSFIVSENRALVANFTYSGGSNHEYVDLGLPSGTLWATCNVGADSPEDYGDYFAWGETNPKDVYNWSAYQYCNGSSNTLTKYCNNSDYGYNGFTDNLTTLLPENDAATATWGNDWRIPTNQEWDELYHNTTHTWITQNGVNGRLFVASNGNSLFLPAAGYNRVGGPYSGNYGYYWSNSLCTNSPCSAWACYFNSDGCSVYYFDRDGGQSVRAVCSINTISIYTNVVTNITSTSAVGAGIVTSDGGSTVIERGICWSTYHNPTISGNHASSGTGTGSFSVNMTGLTANTTYYVRAYAHNSAGIVYGSEVSFTTLHNVVLPTVTTSQVTNIAQTTATGGGNVTSAGYGTVTVRGICWSTNHNPTTIDSHNSSGSGTGAFTADMTGLSEYTTYYVRAYAINSAGTAYGDEVSFISSQIPSYTISVSSNPSNGGTVSGDGIYEQGQTCTLTATAINNYSGGYSFSNWTEDGVQVSTSASYSFIVTGNRTLMANFTYNNIGGHGYVNLGLPSGRLWATCNVGADNPVDYGDYFAWGEIQTKYYCYNWSNYQYSYHDATFGNPMLMKYCTIASYGANGFVDNLTSLLSTDDVATAKWGTSWRMPTKDDWLELIDNTSHIWTTRNGVNGYLFTASNGNQLFLPASGACGGSNPPNTGSDGLYWSESLRTDHPSSAWYFHFNSGNCNNMGTSESRYKGLSVRPVH